MHYFRFLIRRLLLSIPVLFGVTVVVFLMIHLIPGDPARTVLGSSATPEAIADLQQEWGLDQSLPSQYLKFMGRLFGGDLGTSLRSDESAGTLVFERLPVTLWLIAYATVLTCLIAVPLALLAASRPGGIRDRVIRIVCVAGIAIPSFWLGLILLEYVAVDAQLFTVAGVKDGFAGHLESLFLPSLTVAGFVGPLIVRSLRAELIKVGNSEFVTTARSKGLPEWSIRMRHVLRNALGPAVTVLAVNVSFLVGGTLVIEKVFALGGVGDLMVSSIGYRDFPVIQAVTLVLAFFVVLVNIAGDLAHALLDPRVDAQ